MRALTTPVTARAATHTNASVEKRRAASATPDSRRHACTARASSPPTQAEAERLCSTPRPAPGHGFPSPAAWPASGTRDNAPPASTAQPAAAAKLSRPGADPDRQGDEARQQESPHRGDVPGVGGDQLRAERFRADSQHVREVQPGRDQTGDRPDQRSVRRPPHIVAGWATEEASGLLGSEERRVQQPPETSRAAATPTARTKGRSHPTTGPASRMP